MTEELMPLTQLSIGNEPDKFTYSEITAQKEHNRLHFKGITILSFHCY